MRIKAENDLQLAKEKLTNLERDRSEMANDAERVTSAVEAAKANVAQLEGVLKECSSEYNRLKEENDKILETESRLVHELGKARAELDRSRAEANIWRNKTESLRREYAAEWSELRALMKSTADAAITAGSTTAISASAEDVQLDIDSCFSLDSVLSDSTVGELPILSDEELSVHKTEDLKRSVSALEAERET